MTCFLWGLDMASYGTTWPVTWVLQPGFVAQDTQLFTCSIEENLAYGLGREHSKDRGTWMERRWLSKKVVVR